MAASLTLIATATVPLLTQAADHLDAPGLTPPSGRADADINDLYVFTGADPNATVLAMTVSPAAGAIGPDTFGTDVLYQFNLVDIPTSPTPFGFTADEAIRATFGAPGASGNQPFNLYRATGADADGHSIDPANLILSGMTNQNVDIPTGGKFFAGLRSDPFFFDLGGFQGTVEGASNSRMLNDGMESDFFADLNVLALVVEIPDAQIPDSGDDGFATWASTAIKNNGGWDQVDRIGRPAINTVVNSTGPIVNAPSANKDLFNAGHPGTDDAFEQAVEDALAALSALDSEGPYDAFGLSTLSSILLPDRLFFDDGSPPSAPFNGRRLEDDVIDIELNLLTGGFPFVGRDDMGAVTTDGIGPHSDYLSVFPYLGEPHVTLMASISVMKEPASQTVDSGGTATFTITVENTGNVLLTNVQIVDPAAPSCDSSISSMAAGEKTTYQCNVTGVTDSFTNIVTASGVHNGDVVIDDDSAIVVVGKPATVGVIDQDQGLWYLVDPVLADLSGDKEVPSGSGDPNGSGKAVVTFNNKDGKVCFDLDLNNLQGTVNAAHIHSGKAGVNGPIVVDFDWPNNGTSGCVTSTTALIDQILADLDAFYVNVHSDVFPAGAVRGQLGGGPLPPFYFGNPEDDPFLGDWDGDGIDTPGMHRPSDGKVYLRNSNTPGIADIEFFFGNPDDVPLIGDWDGDGDDTVSLYRPSEGKVFIINELGSNNQGLGAADIEFIFGDPGDDPFSGDFDGDGKDTVGVKRGSVFYWRNSLNAGPADNTGGLIFGDLDDEAMFGDWDGDGLDTPGVFRPSTSTIFLRNIQTPGISDMEIFTDGFESGDTSAWTR